jgi:hypothetical protein
MATAIAEGLHRKRHGAGKAGKAPAEGTEAARPRKAK